MKIAIVGTGIMGRTLAWRLASLGYDLSLYDRDDIHNGQAVSYTAAGMLTPYAEVESAEDVIFAMGKRSLQLWPEIIASLKGKVRYNNRGSLVVSHPQDRGDLLRFNQRVRRCLHPGEEAFQPLEGNAIKSLESELAERFSEASYFPEEAWISAQDIMQVLAENLLEQGVHWHSRCDVGAISPHTLVVDGQKQHFDWVFDCRGLAAKNDFPELRGVRGELIWLDAPEVKISRLVRLMHPRYRLYLVPLMQNNHYILGATQIESEDDSPLSVRSALELLSAAFSLHSGFAEARILKTKTHCRPAFKDNLPRVDVTQGLARVNGLFRHGYLLAPTIAEEVVNWLETQQQYSTQYECLIRKAG